MILIGNAISVYTFKDILFHIIFQFTIDFSISNTRQAELIFIKNKLYIKLIVIILILFNIALCL